MSRCAWWKLHGEHFPTTNLMSSLAQERLFGSRWRDEQASLAHPPSRHGRRLRRCCPSAGAVARRTAAARRAQRDRATGRCVQLLLRGFRSLDERRGGRPSALGAAVAQAFQRTTSGSQPPKQEADGVAPQDGSYPKGAAATAIGKKDSGTRTCSPALLASTRNVNAPTFFSHFARGLAATCPRILPDLSGC